MFFLRGVRWRRLLARRRILFLLQGGNLLGRCAVPAQQRVGKAAAQLLRQQAVALAGRFRPAQAVPVEAPVKRGARQRELRGDHRRAPADQEGQPHQAQRALAVRAQAPERSGNEEARAGVGFAHEAEYNPA
ncbi:hypothetical protein [Hyphomonas sp.]|uniref:hypothetical protein n=1 Tax=Hyphomonas sp. TaxID=87 RepID=UPI00391C7591